MTHVTAARSAHGSAAGSARSSLGELLRECVPDLGTSIVVEVTNDLGIDGTEIRARPCGHQTRHSVLTSAPVTRPFRSLA